MNHRPSRDATGNALVTMSSRDGAQAVMSSATGVACGVALFVAMPEEAVAIRGRIKPEMSGSDGRLHGTWANTSVRLQVSGPGVRQAEAAARRMFATARPSLALCVGLAGGLRHGLRRGDIVVAERVVDEFGRESYGCSQRFVESAERHGARRVHLMTHPRVVCSVAEKRLWSARADVVDMESLAVARVAADVGVPFAVLRVVSDAAVEGFPLDLNRYIDSDGNVRRLALAVAALMRPRGLAFLLGMRACARRASYRLATFLEHLMIYDKLEASRESSFSQPPIL